MFANSGRTEAHENEEVIQIAVQPIHHVLVVLVGNLVVNVPVVALLAEDLGLRTVVVILSIGTRTAQAPFPGWLGRHPPLFPRMLMK